MLRALNGNPTCSNSESSLSPAFAPASSSTLDRSAIELIVRRAFTCVQLRTILEENHHSFLIMEHRRYERARDMAGHVAQALKQASREASSYTPLYWTGTWKPWPRIFCFYDMHRAGQSQGRGISEEMASQTTWEAFS